MYRKLKLACYASNIAMAGLGCVSPLLFLTFRQLYGFSYSLLGLLVVINFCTQLTVDLIFARFPHRFNYSVTLRVMPMLTLTGLLIYSVLPVMIPRAAYFFLALGTVVFSASAGLNEVLVSPVVAAIPSKTPERDMATLHSSYAWGLVGIVVLFSLLLNWVGADRWFLLPLALMVIPLIALILFSTSSLPPMESGVGNESSRPRISRGLWLCVICIFLGGAAEGAMTQWVSGYLENAAGIPKTVGDIVGMAMFAATLGLGRSLYAKRGKNVLRVIQWGMAGASVCYLMAALCTNAAVGLMACVATGFCVSMLWPGSIILVEEHFPEAGVAAYALMAAGGDLGCSVAPQLVGIVADAVERMSPAIGAVMTAEQLGMRAGVLSAAVFPIVGFFFVLVLKRCLGVKNKS